MFLSVCMRKSDWSFHSACFFCPPSLALLQVGADPSAAKSVAEHPLLMPSLVLLQQCSHFASSMSQLACNSLARTSLSKGIMVLPKT